MRLLIILFSMAFLSSIQAQPFGTAISLDGNGSSILGPDTTNCSISAIPLFVHTPGKSHLWSDGSTSSDFAIGDSGTYWVQLSTSCGISSDTLSVTLDSLPHFDLGKDTTICNSDTISLTVLTQTSTYL